MPHQVSPYSSKTGKVYHIYGVCTAGKAIKRGRKVKGKGNKKLLNCKAITSSTPSSFVSSNSS